MLLIVNKQSQLWTGVQKTTKNFQEGGKQFFFRYHQVELYHYTWCLAHKPWLNKLRWLLFDLLQAQKIYWIDQFQFQISVCPSSQSSDQNWKQFEGCERAENTRWESFPIERGIFLQVWDGFPCKRLKKRCKIKKST